MKNSTAITENWDTEKLEYKQANEWWRTLCNMRHRDIVFFTAIEVAIITVLRTQLLNLQVEGIILSIIGFFIALIGLNNECRLYKYLCGFRERARQIEDNQEMTLISKTQYLVGNSMFQKIKSSLVFRLYYAFIAAIWLVLWILQPFA
jgi:hypothetical protein